MIVTCAHCGNPFDKVTGHVNRARKLGLNIYCNRTCSGLGRRTSKEEKKKVKSDYDRKRRNELADILKEKAKKYNASPAGRAMQKRNRDKFKENHRQYIKSDSYRKWKHEYDQKYHARKNYGEFWEAFIVLKEIDVIIEPEKDECKIQKGTYNKSQKRKRLWNSQQKI